MIPAHFFFFPAEYIYNSWPIATVYIEILDANDNDPVWVIPEYPENDRATSDTYFGVIPREGDINTRILTVLVNNNTRSLPNDRF